VAVLLGTPANVLPTAIITERDAEEKATIQG